MTGTLPRMSLRALEWDSEILGVSCAQLDFHETQQPLEPSVFDADLKTVLAEAAERGVRFITAKIGVNENTILNCCIRHGGDYIDSEITFAKERNKVNPAQVSLPDGFRLTMQKSYWDERIHQIGDTLRHSRFFMDRHLSEDQGSAIWRTSLFNSCTGRAAYSIVCLHGDRPVGLMNIFEKGGASDIFVIGVAPDYQNMRLGRTMMDYYQANLPEHVERLTVETYLSNYRAQNLYTGCGYRADAAKHIIHFWLQD